MRVDNVLKARLLLWVMLDLFYINMSKGSLRASSLLLDAWL